ncbi:MAG TPA: di-heme oxidoredictase family protein [Candidatus Acidoferrum sp.]|nr:di-heme oxidoredictase family protein [Candidatus Acidoferrum sp.]
MRPRKLMVVSFVVPLFFSLSIALRSQQANTVPSSSGAKDPGVRAGSVNAGSPLSTLTSTQLQYFQDGLTRFQEVDQVANGLGPTFNSNSCSGCHAQPAVGGTSPSTSQYPNIGPNPQIEAATANGATNRIPFFISSDGPVREARFPFVVNSNGAVTRTPDGGVHALFTISGRADATGCSLAQPNFGQMQQLDNLIFRIPTPVFGAGLIENITDETILANMQANANLKRQLEISGHPNYGGNDGSITRFGWKAQNKSLAVFAGEAYNVEIGVTNELFPDERANPPASCLMNPTPEDSTNFDFSGAQIPSDVVQFANFMRFLAPPAPASTGIPGSPLVSYIQNGQSIFDQIHCTMCHTPSLMTSTSKLTPGLNNQTAALFSDLLVHHMGAGLADNISQGSAGPDEFRTAPLWGLGQRIFFLHDGRSSPANGGLVHAIEQHAGNGSEANAVVGLFNRLSTQQQQDLLNFLRSL